MSMTSWSVELCQRMDEVPTESLWVRIKGEAKTGDILVGAATGHQTRKTEWV